VESEQVESTVADVKRIMIRMFNKLKEDIQNNPVNPKRMLTKLETTQKQLKTKKGFQRTLKKIQIIEKKR
jgi:hypothetical protein